MERWHNRMVAERARFHQNQRRIYVNKANSSGSIQQQQFYSNCLVTQFHNWKTFTVRFYTSCSKLKLYTHHWIYISNPKIRYSNCAKPNESCVYNRFDINQIDIQLQIHHDNRILQIEIIKLIAALLICLFSIFN